MFLGWGFRVAHQHHIASFSYLADDIILTISSSPHSHRHVQCTIVHSTTTILWVQSNTPASYCLLLISCLYNTNHLHHPHTDTGIFYNEHCTNTIIQSMGFRGTHHRRQPTLIDWIGRVVVMFLVSYSYHTDKMIQTYTQTQPHTSTWGHTFEKHLHKHSEQHTETQRHAHKK